MTEYIKRLIDWLRYESCSDCIWNRPPPLECNATACIMKQIAIVMEEMALANDDLMFENESKQNRINKLQAELEQCKNERDALLSELYLENNCEICDYFTKDCKCDLDGTGTRLVLNGFCHSWKWHGLTKRKED